MSAVSSISEVPQEMRAVFARMGAQIASRFKTYRA